MLVLTRKPGEVLRIGDDVTVTVLSVRGNIVRLGIAAPKSVAVHRQEVFDRMQRERDQRTIPQAEGIDAPGAAE